MRQCGDCNLCCKLLPVVPLGKVAGQRCQHQRHTGCRVYRKAGMPQECSLWNCRWLAEDDTANMSRPDRSHIVIDTMPDFVTAQNNETGDEYPIEVIQCWVDPRHPDAHRSPEFRAFVARQAEQGKLTLIRYDSQNAFTLFAPKFTGGDWVEFRDGQSVERSHTVMEIAEALAKTERSTHGQTG